MTGLTPSAGLLYAIALSPVVMRKSSLVVVNGSTLEVLAATELETVIDAHALAVSEDGAVYVASTGTDEIVRLDLDDLRVVSETVVWRPPTAGPREDLHHVNSIVEVDGMLVAAGFGPKDGDLWTTARNGFIWNITREEPITEGIYHPHSVTAIGGTLAWCASATRTVEFLDGRRSESLDGYVRGLCSSDSAVFVGTSKGRLISRSEGTFTALGQTGAEAGSCQVVRLDAETLDVTGTAEVGGGFSEVFDVVAFDRERV